VDEVAATTLWTFVGYSRLCFLFFLGFFHDVVLSWN